MPFCMTLPVIVVRRSRRLAFTKVARQGTKAGAIPLTHPTVEEIIAVMRAAGGGDGARLRALIVILWRAGLRIGEALDLAETDLDVARGAVLVRRGECRIRHSPRYAGAHVMPNRCCC